MSSKNKCKICGLNAIFAYNKEDKEKFCKIHKHPTMINVKHKRCEYENCKSHPSYGYESDGKRVFCKEHKKTEMIDLKNKKCQFENGCGKRPLYNLEGEKCAIFCKEHKNPEMINVINKRCQFEDCDKIPSYNFETELRPIFCKKHKQHNMVDILSKKCKFIGCNTQANYNHKNEKIALFCVEHKEQNMINVKSKTCKFQDCVKQPNYNYKDQKIPIFCADHKEYDMVNVKYKSCKYEGCETFPKFNYISEKTAIFCSKHKEPNMVDINHAKCKSENCKTVAIYGYIGQELSYCGKCASKISYKGLYKTPNKICEDDCKEIAAYGINEPLHCEEHSKPEEICLIVKTCIGCNRENEIINKEGLCVEYCQPDKKFQQIKQEKKKEKKVLKYLDDNQHKGYSKEENCELVRMHQIYEALGLPCIFLRFNPDNYRVNGKLVKINITSRLEQLVLWLKYCFELKEPKGILYKFLYYDNYNETDKNFLEVNDIELCAKTAKNLEYV
jgi:hypothetical protein